MTEPRTQELLELLAPILDEVAALNPRARTSPDAVAELESRLADQFPPDGDTVRAIGALVRVGVRDGWLCDRGPESARFSRIAKPSQNAHGLSIDCVSMIGTAIDHTHPNGEITIGFAAEGADPEVVRFEDRPAGWVFLGPGTRHRPQVDGGRMNLIYFLPDGAVQWHTD
jgi:hypothetical protein